MTVSQSSPARSGSAGRQVTIGPAQLGGYLGEPKTGSGIVIFAHGSGSGRNSPRNQLVARALQSIGLGTLLLDLLTEAEAQDVRKVFDIDLLADRLLTATDWLRRQDRIGASPVGYFGASTGAGAALTAAARLGRSVEAIVSRGGRPDLAGQWLRQVTAPTLLIVGSADTKVLALNRQALSGLAGEKELAVIPRATHLFEEPGALERVMELSSRWFEMHLGKRRS
jgi:putative phosphoribosyl transferase